MKLHPVDLFLFSCACLLLCAAAPVRAGIRREAESLVNWKASLAGADGSLGSWSLANSTSLCSWTHISCNSAGHVTGIDIKDTSLNGTLDRFDCSAFPHLQNLTLSQNGLYGTIPEGIGNLKSLVGLDINSNLYLSGAIPRSIGQLKHLVVLRLAELGLDGTLPEEIGNMTSLEVLTLHSVTLTGSIPLTIGMLVKLQELNLGYNNLTGSIPLEIGNMTELQNLYFSHNYLEGQVPGTLSHLIKLQDMYLSENQLGGHNVAELGNSSRLRMVDIHMNNFSGMFPSTICVGGALRILIAAYNGFTGIHQQTFRNCTNLQYVGFTANNIVADLRDCLVEHSRQLKLIGPVPDDFTNLTGMVHASKKSDDDAYVEQIQIVWKNMGYGYSTTITGMVGIDLSGNFLSQEIPDGLTTLVALRYLNLSGNHLSGCIPKDIGNLLLLESLDLSRNQLSGEIPPSFAGLKSISTLNLSSNGLSGRIPTSNQLQTLADPSIYSNNLGLCGFPLEDCVSSSILTPSKTRQGEDMEALWLYCFVAAGFIFGLWLYWGMFLFYSETWRCAFYQYVDNMQGKVGKKVHCCISWFQAKALNEEVHHGMLK
uniref:Uncharacterized protein n=1 Tax=Avena sativa TaxID=4498 RepID=A0ACD5XAM4_AVESA